MYIARLGDVVLHDTHEIPSELAECFQGPHAMLTKGGNLRLYGTALTVTETLPAFLLVVNDRPVGAVLLDELDMFHRRTRVHVELRAGHRQKGYGFDGLLMASVILGDCMGIEKAWTYALEGSPGHYLALKLGLAQEGRLIGHRLTPDGRKDILVLGGIWPQMRKSHLKQIDRIEWLSEVPHGKQDNDGE